MAKVTIQLTSQQQEQIRKATGAVEETFTYEALENRDAPKMGGAASFIHDGGSGKDIGMTKGNS